MKYYMNKLCVILFTLVVLVGFSSCETDDYISRTNLNCGFQSYTNKTGFFSSNGGGDYTFNDLPGLGHGNIIGMEYQGTELTITGDLRYGDVIRDLYIDVEGMTPFLFSPKIDVLKDYEVMVFDTYNDPQFYDFMNSVMRRFYNQGRINIVVDGYLTNRYGVPINGTKIEIYLKSYLDVRMRE